MMQSEESKKKKSFKIKGKYSSGFTSFWSSQVDIEAQRQKAREEARKEQERVNKNRESSPHAEYFKEQEKVRELGEKSTKEQWKVTGMNNRRV